MSDIGTHHFVKAGEGSGNVLVPQPSNDPHDPLVSLVQSSALTQMLTTAELEPFLEDFGNILINSSLFCSGFWAISISAYVSAANESIRCESRRGCAIHWCLHSGPWLQQLHMVRPIPYHQSRALTETGCQSRRHSADVQSSYCRPSSALPATSGVPLQRIMQASWAHVCLMVSELDQQRYVGTTVNAPSC